MRLCILFKIMKSTVECLCSPGCCTWCLRRAVVYFSWCVGDTSVCMVGYYITTVCMICRCIRRGVLSYLSRWLFIFSRRNESQIEKKRRYSDQIGLFCLYLVCRYLISMSWLTVVVRIAERFPSFIPHCRDELCNNTGRSFYCVRA